jgi:EAL domain-containing protein (putative c-di-GMP-specific phosphodiesterase class I)
VITFEITETALMRDIEAGEAFASRVVDLGCELALDDFGTGFGSFTT